MLPTKLLSEHGQLILVAVIAVLAAALLLAPRRRKAAASPHGRIADLRRVYSRAALDITDVDANPATQFQRWFDEARAAGVVEPNAMTLATVDADGAPNARMVLLKSASEEGFTFYTDYRSAKGRELAARPHAALVFWWHELERQVRVRGRVERVSREESAAYFHSRPHGSQVGAWASHQSQPVPDREALDALYEAAAATHGGAAGGSVPLPPHWGGFRVVPTSIEFWQGRPNRLHDRLRYSRTGDGTGKGAWKLERLCP